MNGSGSPLASGIRVEGCAAPHRLDAISLVAGARRRLAPLLIGGLPHSDGVHLEVAAGLISLYDVARFTV